MIDECPKCERDLEKELREDYYNCGDYPTSFEFVCPGCGTDLSVAVESSPSFYVSIPKPSAGFGQQC